MRAPGRGRDPGPSSLRNCPGQTPRVEFPRWAVTSPEEWIWEIDHPSSQRSRLVLAAESTATRASSTVPVAGGSSSGRGGGEGGGEGEAEGGAGRPGPHGGGRFRGGS